MAIFAGGVVVMSTARGLRNRIVLAAVEIARRNAARPQRALKRMHRGERVRELRRFEHGENRARSAK